MDSYSDINDEYNELIGLDDEVDFTFLNQKYPKDREFYDEDMKELYISKRNRKLKQLF